MPSPSTLNRSVVRPMTQLSENSSSRRESIAKPSPRRRALSLRWSGSRPTRMEMKMMLSTPRTISRAVSIAKAIQVLGSSRISIVSLGVCCVQQPLHQRMLDAAFSRDEVEVFDQFGGITEQPNARILEKFLARPKRGGKGPHAAAAERREQGAVLEFAGH